MSSAAQQVADKVSAVVVQGDAVIRPSKIPASLRFPLVAIISIALSSFLYSFTANVTVAKFAGVSRRLDSWGEVGALVAYRFFELSLGWYADFDGYDLASLTLLSHGPPLYLLGTFYEINPLAIVLSLLIDATAAYIPFRALRPLLPAHNATASTDAAVVPNNDIVTSTTIQAYTTILAASIYSVTLYTAYSTYLPVYLVTYFDNIKTLEGAHSATPISLLPLTLLFGLAARSFIFTPAAAVGPISGKDQLATFSSETATLYQTVYYNLWSFSTRNKVIITRTAAVAFVLGTNTFVQTLLTIEGVEAMGAVAYALPFVVAIAITGVAFSWVGVN